MPSTATISVSRKQLIEVEYEISGRFGAAIQQLAARSKKKPLEVSDLAATLRLVEELAAVRTIGQEVELQLELNDFDFGFDDEHDYDGPLAEAEELGSLIRELVLPAVTPLSRDLGSRLTAMLGRLDQQIRAVHEHKVEVDLEALGIDPEDLPGALTGIPGGVPPVLPEPVRRRLPVKADDNSATVPGSAATRGKKGRKKNAAPPAKGKKKGRSAQ